MTEFTNDKISIIILFNFVFLFLLTVGVVCVFWLCLRQKSGQPQWTPAAPNTPVPYVAGDKGTKRKHSKHRTTSTISDIRSRTSTKSSSKQSNSSFSCESNTTTSSNFSQAKVSRRKSTPNRRPNKAKKHRINSNRADFLEKTIEQSVMWEYSANKGFAKKINPENCSTIAKKWPHLTGNSLTKIKLNKPVYVMKQESNDLEENKIPITSKSTNWNIVDIREDNNNKDINDNDNNHCLKNVTLKPNIIHTKSLTVFEPLKLFSYHSSSSGSGTKPNKLAHSSEIEVSVGTGLMSDYHNSLSAYDVEPAGKVYPKQQSESSSITDTQNAKPQPDTQNSKTNSASNEHVQNTPMESNVNQKFFQSQTSENRF